MTQFIHKRGGGRIIGHGGGGGKGGGGGSRQPVESPDSLHSTAYARVLDLVSEGPIFGPVHGLASMGRDVYLDGTPVMNENGTLNFRGVEIDFRAGTQDQDYIPGFPAAEATTGVGVEVRDDTPWAQFFGDTSLSAVRVTLGWQGLSKANTENGDITGYRINYVIEVSTDGGLYVPAVSTSVNGKTTQLYERTHRINLPSATTGWTIRVRRTTPNANSSTISDTMLVNSYTTVIDAKLRYPMSALFGIQVDASAFRSVPQRSYHLKLRIISVPTNYDPETRQYTGDWDGTFKQAWTNNPAWIFYDLVANDRYGAGERLTPQALSMLKWTLYPIAQYCDELVPDGMGGMEPRYTCNVYIQEDADAVKVVNDLASIFTGMVYEMSGAVMASADIPTSWSYNFSNANVRDGIFKYAGTPLRTRYSVAQVSYNDMSNFGRAKVEVYEDAEAIRRYGVRVLKLTAFGCTSRGQAIRAGKWAILSAKAQTDTVHFQTGLEHAVVAPGAIIRVSDNYRAGRRIGGRVREVVSATEIVLDRPVSVTAGDRLIVNLPSGIAETRIISSVTAPGLTADTTSYTVDSAVLTADMTGLPNAVSTIVVTEPFSELPEVESVWTVESSDLVARLYRVRSVKMGEGLWAEITAIEHNPSKYDAIDFGTKIEVPPVTVVPPNVMPIPQGIVLTSYSTVAQGIASHTARIEWEPVEAAVEYQVHWRRDESDWIDAGRTGSTSVEVSDIRRGAYLARVRSINAMGIPSEWGYSVSTQLSGNLEPPPAVASLSANSIVFGIQLRWGFPTDAISPIEKTEIMYGATNNRADATLLGEFPYPQNTHSLMGLAAGQQFYFWARLVDKNGEAGPWYPSSATGGVLGTASTSAGNILDYLTGEITETQLATELLEKIEEGDGAIVRVEALENDLAAMYTIKTQLTVDGVPYMAGIGVGVENDEGVITSQILLAAARVAILDESSGTTVSPFVVQGGQVFINQAVIGDGWITNAMIGNVIQSDNYVPGTSGWRINKSGGFEVNGALPGGGRTVVTDQGVSVFDNNNIERVRLGYLA